MERPALTRLAGLGAAAVLLAIVAGMALHRRSAPPGAVTVRAIAFGTLDAHAPSGAHIRVEVLNASRVSGLARRATFHLRDEGFDVVESGNAPSLRDSTLVIDRTGHPDWARLVARAMGGATVVTKVDSSRYVDVTVLIGGAWRPPTKPFYP